MHINLKWSKLFLITTFYSVHACYIRSSLCESMCFNSLSLCSCCTKVSLLWNNKEISHLWDILSFMCFSLEYKHLKFMCKMPERKQCQPNMSFPSLLWNINTTESFCKKGKKKPNYLDYFKWSLWGNTTLYWQL